MNGISHLQIAIKSFLQNVAETNQIDLIIVGTNVLSESDRVYLGPGVENILQMAPCPVIVFNT